MKLTKTILGNSIFALQCLLIFLVIFENYLGIPKLGQVFGRMHPLVLHLPIGFLMLVALLPLIRKELSDKGFTNLQSFALYLTAFTAVLTSLMGLLLSQEEGYESSLVDWHKWLGVGVSLAVYLLLLFHNRFAANKLLFNSALYATVGLILWTGHLGGSITHGEDFLLAPILPEKVVEITDETPVFAAAIEPILAEKCVQCHKQSKSKGSLIMTSMAALQQGGKHGAIWVAGSPDSSRMIKRMYLPLEEEKHMPPKGKPQPSQLEIELLEAWIEKGAYAELTLEQAKSMDTLSNLVQRYLAAKAVPLEEVVAAYPFEAAPKTTIEKLNTPFRSVFPVAAASPALQATIFVKQAYQAEFLQELLEIKEQLVVLNLTNLPIKDEDMATIAQFPNLEKLILNGTELEGTTLNELLACTKLKEIALSNTRVKAENLAVLTELPQLESIYLWNIPTSSTVLAQLAAAIPNVALETGFVVDSSEMLRLSVPLLKNPTTVVAAGESVELINKLEGVVIRYTTDQSEPDSTNGITYETPIEVEDYLTIKAKAYRTNWLSSKVAEYALFSKGLQPDSASLLTSPNPQYKGKGAITLIDQSKGKAENFRNAAWLGYKEEPLEVLIDFGATPPIVNKVISSFSRNIGPEIFPPAKVEIWGGNSKTNQQLLGKIRPEQPTNYMPNAILALPISLPSTQFRYYILKAQSIQQVPKWHGDYEKGRKGWVFMDEVFFY